jgi:membrane-associated phospholipid phosphatase
MRGRTGNRSRLLLLCILVFPAAASGQWRAPGIEPASPIFPLAACAAIPSTPAKGLLATTPFGVPLVERKASCLPGPLPGQSFPSCAGQAGAPGSARGVSLGSPKSFASDILHDQGRIWQFPWQVAHGRHWKPALVFTLATAGLVELDPHDTPYFRRTQSFAGFNNSFSSLKTGLGEGLFPVGFFLAGRVRGDSYAEKTALLAGEALADAEIVSEVMKNVDRRLRPREISNRDFAHTWFKAGGGILIGRGSFPSGHAIGAFAMATVVAERYRQHRWVPWLAYGLASAVGFSRITLQAHFPSDIFAGATLGWAISHYVILRKQ